MSALRHLADHGGAFRRWALFLSFLVSGGLLLFPRLPILLALVVLVLAVPGFRWLPWRRAWPLYLFLLVVLFISSVRPGPIHLESLTIRFANFLGAVVLLTAYARAPIGSLDRDLYAILHWMAIQAIATVVLAQTLGFLFVPVNFAGNTFQSLLLLFNYHTLIENSEALARPDGFFFEPGIFQFYLNLYLYLAIFVFRNPLRIALGTLAVFSTQSTTGILICLILLGAAFFQRMAIGNLRRQVVTAAIALLAAPPIAYLGYGNVVDKLFGETQGSSWAREFDFFTGLNVIAESPWLGIGFDHNRYLAASAGIGYEDTLLKGESVEDRPTTNGLIYMTYSLGIPMAILLIWAMFRQRIFHNRILIGLWLTLSMFGEAIIFTPFVMLIYFSWFLVLRPTVTTSTAQSNVRSTT